MKDVMLTLGVNFTRYTSMRAVLVLVLLATLVGCSSSRHALHHDDERDVVFDPNLVGQWVIEVDDKEAVIQVDRIGDSKAYAITAPGYGLPNEWKSVEARMVAIGGMKILDVTNPRLAASRHDIVKVALDGDGGLCVDGFNYDLLRKKPKMLAHKIDPLYVDISASGFGFPVPRWIADAGITVTASTEELRRFFAEHADDPSIWNHPDPPLKFKRRQAKR